jgi:TrpR-related protein YerC/YecD
MRGNKLRVAVRFPHLPACPVDSQNAGTYLNNSSRLCYRVNTMEHSLNKNRALWELFEAVTRLRDSEEFAGFFRDLCTRSELEAMAERWEVARLVDRGLSYREISRITGASTTTVTRIAHWLKHGEGGYRLLLDRIRGSQNQ